MHFESREYWWSQQLAVTRDEPMKDLTDDDLLAMAARAIELPELDWLSDIHAQIVRDDVLALVKEVRRLRAELTK